MYLAIQGLVKPGPSLRPIACSSDTPSGSARDRIEELLAAVYAFARLRGRWSRYERAALTIPLTAAALASIAEGPVGDWAARDVATTQPIKLAAMEGLYRTTRGAPEHLLGWYTGGPG